MLQKLGSKPGDVIEMLSVRDWFTCLGCGLELLPPFFTFTFTQLYKKVPDMDVTGDEKKKARQHLNKSVLDETARKHGVTHSCHKLEIVMI